jgi:HEAT repeat protein
LTELSQQLSEADPARRAEAVLRLRECGPDAVEPLCRALHDSDADVRVAAVEALGVLGDERALEPLAAALRRCFMGHSARRHVVFGVVVALVVGATAVGLIWGILALKVFGAVGVMSNSVVQLVARSLERRRAHSRICPAITEALERIATRHPSPRLRAVLPELRTLALDVVQQDRVARKASRDTARRIDELTASLKDLPLASAPPSGTPESLPRPAGAPQQEG